MCCAPWLVASEAGLSRIWSSHCCNSPPQFQSIQEQSSSSMIVLHIDWCAMYVDCHVCAQRLFELESRKSTKILQSIYYFYWSRSARLNTVCPRLTSTSSLNNCDRSYDRNTFPHTCRYGSQGSVSRPWRSCRPTVNPSSSSSNNRSRPEMKASPIIVNWHAENAPIYSADFQPHGRGRLATAGGDNNVRVCEECLLYIQSSLK